MDFDQQADMWKRYAEYAFEILPFVFIAVFMWTRARKQAEKRQSKSSPWIIDNTRATQDAMTGMMSRDNLRHALARAHLIKELMLYGLLSLVLLALECVFAIGLYGFWESDAAADTTLFTIVGLALAFGAGLVYFTRAVIQNIQQLRAPQDERVT